MKPYVSTLCRLAASVLTFAALGGQQDCDPGEGGTPVDPACPQASNFLDVSQAPGPGAGYPDPYLSVSCEGSDLVVDSNSIPHYTFVPLTPNALQEVDVQWRVPLNPEVAAATTEIALLGDIGFTVTGLPIYGPNEAAQPAAQAWGDPVYNGIVDGCKGHTASAYHNHALSELCLSQSGLVAEPWLNDAPDPSTPSPIIGYAFDGFPIYGSRGCLDVACSEVVTFQSGYERIGDPTKDAWDAYEFQASDDPLRLDACNGRVGPDGTYRYHATATFPYIIGCYRGTPADNGGGNTPPPPAGRER